jgi:hypothetical protein
MLFHKTLTSAFRTLQELRGLGMTATNKEPDLMPAVTQAAVN